MIRAHSWIHSSERRIWLHHWTFGTNREPSQSAVNLGLTLDVLDFQLANCYRRRLISQLWSLAHSRLNTRTHQLHRSISRHALPMSNGGLSQASPAGDVLRSCLYIRFLCKGPIGSLKAQAEIRQLPWFYLTTNRSIFISPLSLASLLNSLWSRMLIRHGFQTSRTSVCDTEMGTVSGYN